MNARMMRIAVVAGLLLLGFIAAQPYVDRMLFADTAPRPVTARGSLADSERSTIQLFENVSPSVVQVVALTAMTGQVDVEQAGQQTGTGFVWDSAGHIVTNAHVVSAAQVVKVRLASGEIADADIVGRATNYDLAVVRLKSGRVPPPAILIGSSAELKVGQSAFAIGNPFGLDQSLTVGVISALKRRLPTSGGREIANVIQTDASINPGNSGGPLLDSSGRLIGVNTAILSPSGVNAGIGFAIPVGVVNRIVPQLIKSGFVPTPGIGVIVADEAVATRLGVEGIIVVRAVANSAAAKAGIIGADLAAGRLGDVIIAANGRRTHRLADLTDELELVGVGKTVTLTVAREGKKRDVRVDVVDVGPRE